MYVYTCMHSHTCAAQSALGQKKFLPPSFKSFLPSPVSQPCGLDRSRSLTELMNIHEAWRSVSTSRTTCAYVLEERGGRSQSDRAARTTLPPAPTHSPAHSDRGGRGAVYLPDHKSDKVGPGWDYPRGCCLTGRQGSLSPGSATDGRSEARQADKQYWRPGPGCGAHIPLQLTEQTLSTVWLQSCTRVEGAESVQTLLLQGQRPGV